VLCLDLFSFLAEVSFVNMVLHSSRHLHNRMLHSVLRSTMQFFEATPLGRIINRFSKDVNSIEFILSLAYKDIIFALFEVVTIVTTISITTPYFTIVLIPIAVLYFLVQVCALISFFVVF
jgi:ABC-type multidrug transport system fused ATPase/permease subunit